MTKRDLYDSKPVSSQWDNGRRVKICSTRTIRLVRDKDCTLGFLVMGTALVPVTRIVEVFPDEQAALAGAQVDDLIYGVNGICVMGMPLKLYWLFMDAICYPGRPVTITLARGSLRYNPEQTYLVHGKDNGQPAWHYVDVEKLKLDCFLDTIVSGSIDVAQYGRVINSGWGHKPPPQVVDDMDVNWIEYMEDRCSPAEYFLRGPHMLPWYMVGWAPEIHCMFSHECATILTTALLAGHRGIFKGVLPVLPPELWYYIFSFIRYVDYPISLFPAPAALMRTSTNPHHVLHSSHRGP